MRTIRAMLMIAVAVIAAAANPLRCDPATCNADDPRPAVSSSADAALKVLSRRCLSCHNSVDRKGDVSVHTADDFRQAELVSTGPPAQSLLWQVITQQPGESAPRMPKNAPALESAERAALERWISDGAPWPNDVKLQEAAVDNFDWWSFRPIIVPEIPKVTTDLQTSSELIGWDRNPIDAFILATLRKQNLQPSAEADRRTLIRRLSFDLIGLPPSPEDIEEFVNDQTPGSYERLVDRLLESPQYGERWARHWLDVVKYADTCGYDKDKLRSNAWPYRDYVIRSFNEDKPYDRFVQEQLAGDILFPDTPDGITALGFIAAGPWDFIGHVEVPESKIDGKVARNLDRDDMVSNALNAFCSVTIQCARCHNHKFDPFTQQHYYGLQAVFAAVDRADRPWESDPATAAKRRQLAADRAACQQRLDAMAASVIQQGGTSLADAEKRIAELKSQANGVTQPEQFGYHSQIAAAQNTEKWVQIELQHPVSSGQIILHPCSDDFAGIGAGFGFPVRFQVQVAETNTADFKVIADNNAEDFANPGLLPVTIEVTQPQLNTLGISQVQLIRVTASKLALRQNDYILALAEIQVVDASRRNVAAGAKIVALDSIEAPARWGLKNLTDGLWPTAADPALSESLAAAEAHRRSILAPLETPSIVAEGAELSQQVAALDQQLAALPAQQMVYAAATHFKPQGNFQPTQGKPRDVHVLHRGNETQPLTRAVPGTIPLSAADSWTFPLDESGSEGERRASLARWITDRQHPLTWRSIVNRVWQYHFGRPLADSPNDFGRMGQLPTHPELLDWLAADFRDHGQSFRRLHRMIVTSATWKQASSGNSQNALADNGNQYLWRANRRRLAAEEIRDAILQVSGRMNSQMGGPGFYLFDLEKTDHSPHYEYHSFDPGDVRSHRRSIYRFIVRSQPDPLMTTLDCADSSQSTPRRSETLTSLQALSLLNHRFTLVMAEHFAARAAADTKSADISEQARRAYHLALGRQPDQEEVAALRAYANEHGMANLCRLLFNMSEFVFVE
jgi:hypothetical protein